MCDRSKECEIEKKQEIELVEKEQKFSAAKFFIGLAKLISSMPFIAWAVYTILFIIILWWIFVMSTTAADALNFLKTNFIYILAGGWVLTTFVMAINLQKGINTMVSNAKINAEIKAGFSKNLDIKANADAAQVVRAINNN